MPSLPKVSAILAVYNSGKTIETCLESLMNQSIPVEIIVIDDGSTDTTVEIIKRYYVSKQSNIKILQQKHQGPGVARNKGASAAHGGILLFVDADMVFDRRYVEDLIAPLKKNEIIGTYTANEQVANWDNVWARCWNWQEGWEPRLRFPTNAPEYGTDFRAIRHADFDRVGGFDNIGYTDTWSLFQKLHVRPKKTMALCYHKNPDSLRAAYRQSRWAAKRPYKYGRLGTLYALARTSFLVSLCTGCLTAIRYKEPAFLLFKVVYDWGRFAGILSLLLTGNTAK
jgi:glycosyltransferase involved in cell wall biosynthesis